MGLCKRNRNTNEINSFRCNRKHICDDQFSVEKVLKIDH